MSRPSEDNIVLGRGEAFIDPYSGSDERTGERYVGEAPGLSLAGTVQNTEVYSSTGPVREKIRDITTQIDRSGNIVIRNVSKENLALWLIADTAETSQANDSVTAERRTVQAGRWYQLGQTDSDPVGVQDVSNVTVQQDPDGTPSALTVGNDYVVDEDTGRVYFVIGGAVGAEPEPVDIDYDTGEASWDLITSSALRPIDAAFRFISHNAEGANRNLYIPQVTLTPDGELEWISADQVKEIRLAMRVQKRPGMAQVYINGRPA